MRTASCFAYIVLTILYCLYTGDLRTLMYLLGQCTILVFIVALCCFILSARPITHNEKLFLYFSLYMTAGRAIYTCACVVRGSAFAFHNTDIFGMLTAFCFLVLVLHICFSQLIKK